MLGAFALLGLRFVYLQLVQHDYYRTKAEDNRISVVPLVPNRGLILDRNGVCSPGTNRNTRSRSTRRRRATPKW